MIHITHRFHVFHDQKVLYLEKMSGLKMAIYNVKPLHTFSSEVQNGKGAK